MRVLTSPGTGALAKIMIAQSAGPGGGLPFLAWRWREREGLPDRGIKSIQCVGAKSHPVQKAKEPHVQDRVQGSPLFPSPKGGGDFRAQGGDPPELFESLGEFDVFHQGDVCKPAHVLKRFPPNKNGLIACGNA